MTPRFTPAARARIAATRAWRAVRPPRGTWRGLIGLLAIGSMLAACQTSEVDDSQVCAFQCDYQQNGTEPGYPAAAAGVEARLTIRDVVQVIANAIAEAQANGIPDVTIVVLDHLSNVLAVYDTDDSTTNFSLITSAESPDRTTNGPWIVENNGGSAAFDENAAPVTLEDFDSLQTSLDGVFIPMGYAAISKAGTVELLLDPGQRFLVSDGWRIR